MFKIAAIASSVLLSIGLAALAPPPQGPGEPPPKGKAKGKEAAKKKDHGPAGDLTKAYDLLRRLRADETSNVRPEERIRDWTERASKYYRDGLKAFDDHDEFHAHEYGAVAHDLARAADHARKAALFDRRDPELPSPPAVEPGRPGDRNHHDLRRVHDRITEFTDRDLGAESGFYLKAARDLYNAARRDIEAGRHERGGELARAAEAMTHVAKHLGHADAGPPEKREHPEPKKKEKDKDKEKTEKGRPDRPESELPPPLPRE